MIFGASPGTSIVRTRSKLVACNQLVISSREKVSPLSEFTSILTANKILEGNLYDLGQP